MESREKGIFAVVATIMLVVGGGIGFFFANQIEETPIPPEPQPHEPPESPELENHAPEILWAQPRYNWPPYFTEYPFSNIYRFPTRLTVSVRDIDGDSMTVQFWIRAENEDVFSPWIGLGNFEGGDGIYSVRIPYETKATFYPIVYYWKVDVSDGEETVTGMYSFSTYYPVITHVT